MSNLSLPRIAGLILGVSMMMSGSASADALKDQLFPTGKLRVAIGISAAGGAYWSTKTETGGYAGVPVDLGKAMADQLGVPVEYVAYQNSGLITDLGRYRRLGHHLVAQGRRARGENVVRPDL